MVIVQLRERISGSQMAKEEQSFCILSCTNDSKKNLRLSKKRTALYLASEIILGGGSQGSVVAASDNGRFWSMQLTITTYYQYNYTSMTYYPAVLQVA